MGGARTADRNQDELALFSSDLPRRNNCGKLGATEGVEDMSGFYITLHNSAGELDREPVTDDGHEACDTDAFKEAIERLVSRIGFFAPGDIIRVWAHDDDNRVDAC
jgi:hypothetical protein